MRQHELQILEYAKHHDYCEVWCSGRSDHGEHRIDGEACTCGYDEAAEKLRAALLEMLDSFGDMKTYKELTPKGAEKVRRIALMKPRFVADLFRWWKDTLT